MTPSLPSIAAVLVLWSTASALAHDGVDHSLGGDSSANTAKPHWLSESRLHVSIPLQQRLALRTARADDSDQQQPLELSAEVIQHPAGTNTINAAEFGRIEADQAWPLAGQSVSKGQVIAWLRPVLSAQQESERQRDLALLEQQLQVAKINLDRLQLQVQASDGVLATNNVYYDEALLDVAALKARIEQARRALGERTALRAPADGVLSAVAINAGDVVDVGSRLFTISGTKQLRIALTVFDADLVRKQAALALKAENGEVSALRPAGREPAPSGQGWRLLYDASEANTGRALHPGEIVTLSMTTAADQNTRSCLRSAAGAELWVQVEPEVFERRRAADCEQIQIAATERWVRDGAAILGQYR